jgi:hypothetical protein
MTLAEWTTYESYHAWLAKEERRVSHEWDKEWDGSQQGGIAINDRQCERITATRGRLGVTDDLLRRFSTNDAA